MPVTGAAEAQHVEKFQMDGQRGEPFLAADDERRAHEVIVDGVGEVIGRDAVALQDDDVLIVLRHRDVALDLVVESQFMLWIAHRLQTDDIGLALVEIAVNFLLGKGAALGVLAVIARDLLFGDLPFAEGGKFLLGAEAGVRPAADDEVFDERAVDVRPLPLVVRPVLVFGALDLGALVKADIEVAEGVLHRLHGALDAALLVGVLDAKIQNAAALMGDALVGDGDKQVAEVDEARGRRGKAGDFRALFKIARRIELLIMGECGIVPGEQALRKCF